MIGTYALLATGCGSEGGNAESEGPIKIGHLVDLSGLFAPSTIQQSHGAQLAVEEINSNGGILGRNIELIELDTQSDNRRYQELARKLISQEQVDVLMGGYASSAREAVRPIVGQNEQLYFYNASYEGGVCDTNLLITGAVPEQLTSVLIPYMIQEYGDKVYTIAADYNFGQIAAVWAREIVEKEGGEIVGEEFIPLEVSQFSQTVENIRRSEPSVLMSLLVGTDHLAFYEQQANANLGVPIASTITGASGYEHKRLSPPALADLHVSSNWFEELDTTSAEDFKERWRAKFPDENYINVEGEDTYIGVYLYKLAVEKAETTDQTAVREALESGEIEFDAPEGRVQVDPKTHHLIRNILLAKVDDNHDLEILEVYEDRDPDWLESVGCNLPSKPQQEQYTPREEGIEDI